MHPLVTARERDTRANLLRTAAATVARHVTVLRFPPVLGIGGGAYAAAVLAARMGLSVTAGDGSQPMPWVHLDDAVNVTVAALLSGNDDDAAGHALAGTFNVVSPPSDDAATMPVSAYDLAHEMARSFGWSMTLPLPVPGFVLGAVLGHERTQLLTGGSPISGKALGDALAVLARDRNGGVAVEPWRFHTLRDALDDLARRTREQ